MYWLVDSDTFPGGLIGMGLIALGGATVVGAIGLVAMLTKKK